MTGKDRAEILIVDDDPMIRALERAILEEAGFTVYEAENGQSAIEFLNKQPRPIPLSLVILDVVMPGLSGLDVLTRMKLNADTQNIPVLMLTGENKNDDMMAGYSVGAEYYITKPFTREQLLYGVKLVIPD